MQSQEEFELLAKNQFKNWSRFYDSKLVRLLYFERLYQKILQTIKAGADIYLPADSKFLDVACGTGEVIFRLAQEFISVEFIGVDFSEDMLAIAKQKTSHLKNVKMINANIKDLPFADKSFDFVLCSDAFHHFALPEESLKEISRVLKDNGHFLLIDPAFDSLFQKLILGLFGKIVETPKNYYSQKELSKLLKNAGFRIDKIFTYYFNNFFICRKY